MLFGGAVAAKLLSQDAASLVLAAVSLTMVALPLLARFARAWAQRLVVPAELPDEAKVLPPDDHSARAIVVGCGRVGKLVGSMLEEHRKPYIVIDSDAAVIADQRRAGKPAFFGDARRPDFLKLCGLDEATALIVSINNARVVDETVLAARALRPDLIIVARARDAAHARHLYEIGVNDACPRPSRRACNSRRRRWSASACRWASSSPRCMSGATSTAPNSSPQSLRRGPFHAMSVREGSEA